MAANGQDKMVVAAMDEKPTTSVHGSTTDFEAAPPNDEHFSPAEVRRVTRKVDWRLIPVLSLMYCISLIDRTNLSLARAANATAAGTPMNIDLNLKEGAHYSIATLMFFIPYIILEIPSQIGLRAFGARWWLGSAVIAWGVVMVGMGFVTNWQGLAGMRALLGVFEAALFPGAAYLIACWYPRDQMATRNGFFYIVSTAVSGLSATLAYGIATSLHGKNGHAGWQWIFAVNGIMTIAIGIIGILFITDFPDKAKFLTEQERHIIITRIQNDRKDAVADTMTWAKAKTYACDLKLWLFGFFFCSSTLGSYSLAYFLPVILAQMGFTSIESQLLVAPPYVWCVIPAIATAMLSDKYRHRAAAICFNATCLIVGTAMYSQLPATKKAARYAGVFLAIGGCNSNIPLVVSWAQSSIREQSKRGFASALVIAFGGIGGILASVAFIEQEFLKGYPTGVFLTIGLNAAVIVFAIALSVFFGYQNRRADRGEIVLEGHEDFRYQY